MRPKQNTNPLTFREPDNGEGNRRRHGRLLCEDLRCDIGQIQDLSASGIKVLCKGEPVAEPGDTITVVIQYQETAMPLQVKLVRADTIAARKYLYGFEFVDLTDEQHQLITKIARVAIDTLAFIHRDSA